jgi:hypothetical protein
VALVAVALVGQQVVFQEQVTQVVVVVEHATIPLLEVTAVQDL